MSIELRRHLRYTGPLLELDSVEVAFAVAIASEAPSDGRSTKDAYSKLISIHLADVSSIKRQTSSPTEMG